MKIIENPIQADLQTFLSATFALSRNRVVKNHIQNTLHDLLAPAYKLSAQKIRYWVAWEIHKHIADELFIDRSGDGKITHQNIFHKLDVYSNVDAIKVAKCKSLFNWDWVIVNKFLGLFQ